MISHIQKFREQLDSGRVCLGVGITFTDPTVCEALCDSVDFLWIDLEHNPIGVETLSAHLIAARAGGAPALVRVPSSEISWAKRVLDIGAEGIIVPQVRSAEEVQKFVSACRYPPMGNRGYGPRRPSNYGRNGEIDYLTHANKHIFVAIQIEAIEAVRELDDILAIEGIDSIVIGPNDLAGSMGHPGEVLHPEVVETIASVVKKSRDAGKYVGTGMGADENYAVDMANVGIQWIQCGSDFSYMNIFADNLYAGIRERLEAK